MVDEDKKCASIIYVGQDRKEGKRTMIKLYRDQSLVDSRLHRLIINVVVNRPVTNMVGSYDRTRLLVIFLNRAIISSFCFIRRAMSILISSNNLNVMAL
jgi:hypothetical protein